MTDSITTSLEIAAPPARVWRALTDHKEFGHWFGVAVDAPFAVGAISTGHVTIEGFEHVRWDSLIVEMTPERRFVYQWRPYAVDPERDYSAEPRTTVTFDLTPTAMGTLLTITESGFDGIPADRREEALRMNTGGWNAQITNVRDHAEA